MIALSFFEPLLLRSYLELGFGLGSRLQTCSGLRTVSGLGLGLGLGVRVRVTGKVMVRVREKYR